jgi:hypothetical protein
MGLFSKFRRGKDDDEPVDLDARSPQLGLKYGDLLLLSEIAKHARDLSQPREVSFYLYASSRSVADAAAGEARGRGFQTAVTDPDGDEPGQWSIVCRTHTVLTPDFVRDTVDYFDALAERYTIEYDGWEAEA